MDKTGCFITGHKGHKGAQITIAILLLAAQLRFDLAAVYAAAPPPPAEDKMTPAVPTTQDKALQKEEARQKTIVYGSACVIQTAKLSKEGFRIKPVPETGDEHYPHYRLYIVVNGPDGRG